MIEWLLNQMEISNQVMNNPDIDTNGYNYNSGRYDMCMEVLKYIEDARNNAGASRKLKESE